MTYREKQAKFCQMQCALKMVAFAIGYDIAEGDSFRDSRVKYGHPRSLHRDRMAVDFKIRIDGKDLNPEEEQKHHNLLHDIWDLMGGSERIDGDLNHYSISHNWMR